MEDEVLEALRVLIDFAQASGGAEQLDASEIVEKYLEQE